MASFRPKPQRIRDPVHNLIEFNSLQFESALWQAIQTPPFQRLRRVRQLGFSEFVFPGATHTRFAHSVGVFHTARLLTAVIRRYVDGHNQQYKEQQAQHAMAAALFHDVGHGMLSHGFESLGREFSWPMAKHEDVSQRLIRDSEISVVLDKEMGKGFSTNVADIIAQKVPSDMYGAVVSSQFDADRLDYMHRDRLMTGVQSSGVDLTWLLANLEVGEVQTGTDESGGETVETLVLGPKAVQAAESYVLALFHLYPNVYLHKTTRGAEVLFQALFRRLVWLNKVGVVESSGLSASHPIVKFINAPTDLSKAMALDDTVFWGSLPMMLEAEDIEVAKLAKALRERKLLRCFDIRAWVESQIPQVPQSDKEDRIQRQARVRVACKSATAALKDAFKQGDDPRARVLVDVYSRDPYKRFQDSKTPLNQILIRPLNGAPRDMAEFSPVIGNAEPFHICRAYHFREDNEAATMIENIVGTAIKEGI